jgi:hypothetical protein
VQVGREQRAGSRTRSLIEAYGSTPDQPVEDLEAADPPAAPQQGDPGLLRALEFLDACVLPPPDLGRSPPPPESRAVSTGGDSPGLRVAMANTAMQRPAGPAIPESAPTDRASRFAGWQVPRGLLYWLGVGAAAGAAWRLTSSPFGMAVAALAASAVLIGLELLLRMIDPRLAHRLGFARAQRGAAFYGAGVALGVGTGLAVAHVM